MTIYPCSTSKGILGSWLDLHMVSTLWHSNSWPIPEALVLRTENLFTRAGFLEDGENLVMLFHIQLTSFLIPS